MTDRVGQHLGNYSLVRLLGSGGQAEVYLGEHRYLNSFAALKVLHASLNEQHREQFLAEAQTLARLSHPSIVRVLDYTVEQGTPVLIMDYSPTGTLRQRYPPGSCLPLSTVVSAVSQVASALQYAHTRHVIHRDVKPENLLLGPRDEVLLSDFGLAVFAPSPELLSTQAMAGTLPYMAPEQLQGHPCFASDQYSLAVVAYEWLTGKRPFRGSQWQLIQQQLYAAPPCLRELNPAVPEEVEAVVLRALSKDPRERYVSVQGFAHALARVSQGVLRAAEDADVTAHLHLTQAELQNESVASSSHSTQPLSSLAPPAVTGDMQMPLQPRPSSSPQQASREQAPTSSKDVNRQRLLAKVRAVWITGVLEHSVHGAALIALGLKEQPDAVANPWHLVMEAPGEPAQALPAGTSIVQAYDEALGELLILGEPGSGKTTLLLELARTLLDRTERDERHPMPVVFNLSSWASKQQPLEAWLIEELNTKYQVPRKLGKTWVEGDQILPLLDGLDEVAPAARTACVKAINVYRLHHGLLPAVVCSRSAEYLAESVHVLLRKAVVVQPLTTQQIEDYLTSAGEALAAVRAALHADPSLRALATTPLMLSVLTLAFHGEPVEEQLAAQSPELQRRQIFAHYVERMLGRRANRARYTPQQTIHWLAWLARQMKRQSQTVFYIERMQPDWLPRGWPQHLYSRLAPGLPVGLLGGLVLGGLILGLLDGPLRGDGGTAVLGGILGMLLFGLVSGLLGRLDRESTPPQEKSWPWTRTLRGTVTVLFNGLLFGLLFPLAQANFAGAFRGTSFVTYGVVGALVFGLIALLLGRQTGAIQSAEVVFWSWRKMGRSVAAFLPIGFCSLVLGLPLLALVSGLYYWVIGGYDLLGALLAGLSLLTSGLPTIAVIGVLGVLFLSGLVGGWSSDQLVESSLARPNQGMWSSARHSLSVGLVTACIVVLLGELLTMKIVSGALDTLLAELPSWLVGGLLVGVVSGLRSGGLACLKHVILRVLLWRTKLIPWNYPHFLDEASNAILLRKVGGGYTFVHQLLLEYFAALQDVPLHQAEAKQPRPVSGTGQGRGSGVLLPAEPQMSLLAARPLTRFFSRTALPQRGLSRRTVLGGLAGLTGLTGTGSVLLWWTISTHALYTYRGHSSSVKTVAWSPDGRLIASAGEYEDGTVQVWSAADGRPVSTCRRHLGGVYAIAWSPDGDIALASSDGTIDMLKVAGDSSGVGYDFSEVYAVAWSPDSRRIALASGEGTLQVRNLADGGSVSIYRRHSSEVSALAWSRDGRHIASASEEGTVEVWNAADGRAVSTYRGHSSRVNAVAWSPDGKQLASASEDGIVQVWEAADGRPASAYRGHFGGMSAVAWSPDSRHIASGSSDGTVEVWNAADGRPVSSYREHSSRVNAVAWSPDGKRIASGSSDGTVEVWNTADGRPVSTYRGHSSTVNAVAWSPDGKLIASGSSDRTLQVWNAADGRPVSTYDRIPLRVYAIAWSLDGKQLASVSGEGVEVWEAADGRPVSAYRGRFGGAYDIAWSPDGKRIASGNSDGTARVWDAGDGRPVSTYRGHFGVVSPLAWSPDGRLIASEGGDGTVEVWNAVDGRPVSTYRGGSLGVNAMAWSPDGKRIAAASGEGIVEVWNAADGRPISTYHEHFGVVNAVAWSPDGKYLASGGDDGSVQVWEVAKRKLVSIYWEFGDSPLVLAWSPDGKRIAIGRNSGTVQVCAVPQAG